MLKSLNYLWLWYLNHETWGPNGQQAEISQLPQHSRMQPVRPMDLSLSCWFKCSLTWSSSTGGKFVLPFPVFPSGCRGLGFLKAGLAVKTGKDGIEYLNLFSVICHKLPHSIQQQVRGFPSLPFVDYGLVESFLVFFHMPCQMQLQVSLHFLNPVPVRSDSSPIPLGHRYACFHC